MSLVAFAHLLGCMMWIGGWMAGVIFTSSVSDQPPQVRAGVFRIVGRLHTMVIGFGALLVVGTGVVLTMNMDAGGLGALMQDAKLWVMVLSGLAGGLLVIFVGLPTATRVAALAVVTNSGDLPPAFEVYRKRLDLVSAIAGGLGVIALLSWYLL